MKKTALIAATFAGLLATAHAQYAAPAPGASGAHAAWEVDAGVGYVFNTNVNGLDNGAAFHLGGYKLEAANSTRETVTKFGGELYYSNITGTGNVELNTLFVSADLGISQRLSHSIEVGITGGLGVGRLSAPNSTLSSTMAFGYQIRPEIIFHVSETVGISVAYRFLHTFPTDSAWKVNPNQSALELSAQVRF